MTAEAHFAAVKGWIEDDKAYRDVSLGAILEDVEDLRVEHAEMAALLRRWLLDTPVDGNDPLRGDTSALLARSRGDA